MNSLNYRRYHARRHIESCQDKIELYRQESKNCSDAMYEYYSDCMRYFNREIVKHEAVADIYDRIITSIRYRSPAKIKR